MHNNTYYSLSTLAYDTVEVGDDDDYDAIYLTGNRKREPAQVITL